MLSSLLQKAECKMTVGRRLAPAEGEETEAEGQHEKDGSEGDRVLAAGRQFVFLLFHNTLFF